MSKSEKTVIKNVTIIDGTGEAPLGDRVVLVEDGKIDEVGTKGEVKVPPDASVVNGGGEFLLPGLIDSHVHVFNSGFVPTEIKGSKEGFAGVIALRNLRSALQAGVTTVRDLTTDGRINLALRSAIDKGLVVGPRCFVSGRGLCMTGGHGTEGEGGYGKGVHEVDGEVEIRKAIREEVDAGVDLIKVLTSHTRDYPEFTQEELNVAVEEAHRLGKKVSAHAGNEVSTRMAALAGVDTIEHGIAIDNETAEIMEEKDITLVPTLWVLNDIKQKTKERKKKYKEIGEYILHRESMEGTLEQYETIIEQLPKTMDLVQNKDINIAAGTDNIRWYVPFSMLAEELRYLTKYGLSNMRAIKAATKGGAEALGKEEKLGTIEEGKCADLIMVESNPLEDMSTFRDVRWTMKGGQVIEFSTEWERGPVFQPLEKIN